MALDLGFDGSAIFGGVRSKRYALMIEDGKVKEVHVEPDNTGISGTWLLNKPFAWTVILTVSSLGCGEGFGLN